MKPKKSGYLFQERHLLQFGLKVAERNKETGAVESVVCRFCVHFGREKKLGKKWIKRHVAQMFTRLFSSTKYIQHARLEHPKRWAEYETANDEKKCAYFSDNNSSSHTLQDEPGNISVQAPAQIYYSKCVIEDVYKDLIAIHFVHETHIISRTKLFKFFRPPTNSPLYRYSYYTNIRHPIHFQLVADYLKHELSFSQIYEVIRVTKYSTGLTSLKGVKALIPSYARAIIAHSLQIISDIASRSWAFTISFHMPALEFSAKKSYYFQIRMCCYVQGSMYSFHVLIQELHGNENTQFLYEIVNKLLNGLCPNWKQTLMAVMLDDRWNEGQSCVYNVHESILENIQRKPIRSWCDIDHVNQAMLECFHNAVDEGFYESYGNLICYVLEQQRHTQDIENPPPNLLKTSWISIQENAIWFQDNYRAIFRNVSKNRLPITSRSKWWIFLLTIAKVVTINSNYYEFTQLSTKTATKRERYVYKIATEYKTFFNAIGPLNDSIQQDKLINCISRDGRYVIQAESILKFIAELGLTDYNQREIIYSVNTTALVGSFIVNIIQRLFDLTSGKSKLQCLIDDAQHFLLPHQLVKIQPDDFQDIVRSQHQSLQHSLTNTEIIKIYQDHEDLVNEYNTNIDFKLILDKCDEKTTFYDGWNLVADQYHCLKRFVGEMATALFSMDASNNDHLTFNWEKEYHHHSSSDFFLESVLHSKQYGLLQTLA